MNNTIKNLSTMAKETSKETKATEIRNMKREMKETEIMQAETE